MSERHDLYTCSMCEGDGQLVLSGVYAETLCIVRRHCKTRDDFIVANRDSDLFECNATALSNRLRWLENNGFLFSEKYGRQKRFFLCVLAPDGKTS